jgi:hypothetical protein
MVPMPPDDSFAPVRRAVAPLAGLTCPWFVAGGWAVDLHLGRVTRAHGDVDVAVYRRDQAAVHAFLAARGWTFQKVTAGRLEPWDVAEWLAPPVHEVHAAAPSGDARLELLLNEGDDLVWRFRKAPDVVVRARSLVERRSAGGIPFFAPEVPLLYKALTSDRRPADDTDFASALPTLGGEPRAWLREALRALASRHPWIAALGGDEG